jgi:LysM repeat protein
MRKFLLFLFAVCFLQIGICQNNKNQEVDIVSHTVELGETVRMISRKYLVSPTEIYKFNKFAVDGVSQGQVLQIPVPRKEPVFQEEETLVENTSESEQAEMKYEEPIAENPKSVIKSKSEKRNNVTVIDHNSQTEHTVLAGETLFSLSRMYNISVDEINLSNGNGLEKWFKVGQIVKIPGTKTPGENESSMGSDLTPSAEVNYAQPESVTN